MIRVAGKFLDAAAPEIKLCTLFTNRRRFCDGKEEEEE